MRTPLLIIATLLVPYVAFAGVRVPAAPAPAPAPAVAPAHCFPTEKVLAFLSKNFNESITWHGTAPGVTLLITESPGGKTWTLLGETGSAKGDDISCILDSGQGAKFERMGFIV